MPSFTQRFKVYGDPAFIGTIQEISQRICGYVGTQRRTRCRRGQRQIGPTCHLCLSRRHAHFVRVAGRRCRTINLPIIRRRINVFGLSCEGEDLPTSFIKGNQSRDPITSTVGGCQTRTVHFTKRIVLTANCFGAHLPARRPGARVGCARLQLSCDGNVIFCFITSHDHSKMYNYCLRQVALSNGRVCGNYFDQCSDISSILRGARSGKRYRGTRCRFVR